MKTFLAALAAPCIACAVPFAYVSNEGSASISVIDVASATVVRTLKTGAKPRGVAVSRDGERVFVSEQAGNALVAYDTNAGRELGRAAVGNSPEAVYLSPDGKWLAVAIEEDDRVALVDAGTMKVDRRIATKGRNPEHAVWSPDGKFLYVSGENTDAVDVIDVARGEVTKQVVVGERPRGIGFLPDGSRAYAAAENADRLAVI